MSTFHYMLNEIEAFIFWASTIVTDVMIMQEITFII